MFLNLNPTPKIAPKGPKSEQGPNRGRIKSKNIGQYFPTVNQAIQVFFKVRVLGFVDAPVMCILNTQRQAGNYYYYDLLICVVIFENEIKRMLYLVSNMCENLLI